MTVPEQRWHIDFCTSWDDEPADTVIRQTSEPIEARNEGEALTKWWTSLSPTRREFFEEEGNFWAARSSEEGR